MGLTCAAVVLGIAAPSLRALTVESWGNIAAAAGTMVGVAVVGIGLLQQLQLAAAAKSGTIHHRAALHNPIMVWMRRLLFCLALVQASMTLWLSATGLNGFNPPMTVMAVSVGVMLATTLTNPNHVLIAEDGLVINVLYYPWERLRFEGIDEEGDVHIKARFTGTFYIRCASEVARQMIADSAEEAVR
jgi:hypothetical protein